MKRTRKHLLGDDWCDETRFMSGAHSDNSGLAFSWLFGEVDHAPCEEKIYIIGLYMFFAYSNKNWKQMHQNKNNITWKALIEAVQTS
jgi:hypothetical protein